MNGIVNFRRRHPVTRLHLLIIILAVLAVVTPATAPVNAQETVTQTAEGATWTLTGETSVAPGSTYTYTMTLSSGTKPTNELAGFHLPNTADNQDKLGTDPTDCTSPEQFCISFIGGAGSSFILDNVQGHDTLYSALSNTSPYTITATFAVAADAPVGSSIEFGAIENNGLPRDGGLTITVASSLTTFVSNTHLTTDASGSNLFQAQSFETGATTGGYTVSEVDIFFGEILGKSTIVKIREDDSGDPATGDPVATLNNPGTFTDDSLNTFTAPAGTTLAASTTYWITVNEGISSSINRASIRAVEGNAETGETGWSIGDSRLWRSAEGTTNWNNTPFPMMIEIRGPSGGDTTLSNDAKLSGLMLEDGDGNAIPLDTDFASDDYEYEVSVVNGIDTVKLTAAKSNANARVVITNDDDQTGSPEEALLDLSVGSNTLTVTVTAEDTSTELIYTVNVERRAPYVCAAPDLSGRIEVWSGTVTVGTDGSRYGYQSGTDAYGALSDTDFEYGGNDYVIEGITQFDNPAYSSVTLDLDSAFPDSDRSKLSLHICDEAYSLVDLTFSTTVNTYGLFIYPHLTSIPASFNWPGATTVQLALSEPVTNTAAEGQPDISGAAQVDKTLTAEQGDIDDDDGLPSGAFPSGYTFEWFSVDALNVETSVGSSSTYTVSSTDMGSTIRVDVSFTDGAGNDETVISDPVGPVVAAARDSCPAGNDWEATLTMGYEFEDVSGFRTQRFGFEPSNSFGDLDPTVIPHGSTPYTVTDIVRFLATMGTTVTTHTLTFAVTGGDLPDGTVLDLGGTEFTVGTASHIVTEGEEQWDLFALGINPTWVGGQEMTVCANLPPGLLSAIVDGTSLVLTYDQDLDTSSIPAASAYEVKVDDGTGASPSSVSVAGKTVTLTLASAVTAANTVTLSYTAPASNPIQDGSGIAALSFTDQAVTSDPSRLVLSRSSLSVGEAGSDTFTVKLATQPSGQVDVTVTSDDIGAATVSPGSLTFTTTNWNSTQTVTVSGEDDSDTDNESLTVTASASGGGYTGKTDTVSVTVTDDDTANLVLSRTSMSVGEAGSDTFTVKLATQPQRAGRRHGDLRRHRSRLRCLPEA